MRQVYLSKQEEQRHVEPEGGICDVATTAAANNDAGGSDDNDDRLCELHIVHKGRGQVPVLTTH